MREERKSVIYDFIFAADQIKFLERNIPQGFKFFFTRMKTKTTIKKQRIALINKIMSIDNIIFNKELIMQFIQIYNGHKDYITLEGVTTAINDTNKHHIINIVTDTHKVYIVVVNDPNDHGIYITIENADDNIRRVITRTDDLRISKASKDHSAIKAVNDLLLLQLQMYLIAYIDGGKNDE